MKKDKLTDFYKTHKGEIIGAGIGAFFGILIMLFGFWRTIFVGLCTVIGFYIGRKFQNKDELIELLDRILPRGK